MDNNVYAMLEDLYKEKGIQAVIKEVLRLYNNMPDTLKKDPEKGIGEVFQIEQRTYAEPRNVWIAAIRGITDALGDFTVTQFKALGDITKYICSITAKSENCISPFEMVKIVKEQDSKGGALRSCQFLAGYTLATCYDNFMAASALYNLYNYLCPEIDDYPIPDPNFVAKARDRVRGTKLSVDDAIRLGEMVFIKKTVTESKPDNTGARTVIDLRFWEQYIQTFLEIDYFPTSTARDVETVVMKLMMKATSLNDFDQLTAMLPTMDKKYGKRGKMQYLIGYIVYNSYFMDKKLAGELLYMMVQLYANEVDMSSFSPNAWLVGQNAKVQAMQGKKDHESLINLGRVFLNDVHD